MQSDGFAWLAHADCMITLEHHLEAPTAGCRFGGVHYSEPKFQRVLSTYCRQVRHMTRAKRFAFFLMFSHPTS